MCKFKVCLKFCFRICFILNLIEEILSVYCRPIVRMSAIESKTFSISSESMAIKPPSHPTYDLNGVIKLALAEDAGDRGLI